MLTDQNEETLFREQVERSTLKQTWVELTGPILVFSVYKNGKCSYKKFSITEFLELVIRLRVAQFERKGPRNFKLASRYVLLLVLLPLLIIIIHLPSLLSLLQCARTLILKGISFYITKCDQYYYKMRLPFLSQSAMSISMKYNSFFTSKCESQVLLQSALVFY